MMEEDDGDNHNKYIEMVMIVKMMEKMTKVEQLPFPPVLKWASTMVGT